MEMIEILRTAVKQARSEVAQQHGMLVQKVGAIERVTLLGEEARIANDAA